MNLISQFSPTLYFHKDEACFPISIEQYLSCCSAKTKDDAKFECKYPNNIDINDFITKGMKNMYFDFIDDNWKTKLEGSPFGHICYCKEVDFGETKWYIYFYLFSHTEAYKACGCLCDMTSYAHKADLKFIVVETQADRISRVYFGAHGTKSGAWKNRDEIEFDGSHPIAYSCRGDHSFYYDSGNHPRIYFVAHDVCARDIRSRASKVVQVYNKDHPLFHIENDSWIYFNGTMNTDGIASPFTQSFWKVEVPNVSNNWFKRLFCCEYF